MQDVFREYCFGIGHGLLAAIEKSKVVFLSGGFGFLRRRKRLEGNPTDQHRQNGLGSHGKAFRPQGNVDAAGLPKAGLIRDVFVVRCPDEDFYLD